MMTAVMMKADTRPARRGSNVGDSWAIVVSPPTLSWDGLSAWPLVWAEMLVGVVMVVLGWISLTERGLSDCEVFGCGVSVGG